MNWEDNFDYLKNKMSNNSKLIYPKTKKKHPYYLIWETYIKLYENKIGIRPEINYGVCGSLIKQRLINHSVKGLVKIIELFFDEEKGDKTVFDLKVILSAYFINKYAPKIKLDPKLYSDAEKWNKETY